MLGLGKLVAEVTLRCSLLDAEATDIALVREVTYSGVWLAKPGVAVTQRHPDQPTPFAQRTESAATTSKDRVVVAFSYAHDWISYAMKAAQDRGNSLGDQQDVHRRIADAPSKTGMNISAANAQSVSVLLMG